MALVILDAIEEGRFPTAKRELDRMLQRYPQKSYFYALKGYYLHAIGNTNDAIKECTDLKKKVPSDEAALALLAKTFARLGLEADAREVYENAVKKYPSESLILAWHSKSVAELDLGGMQKSAMFLHKYCKDKREYLFWAALTNLMRANDEPQLSALYVGLAANILKESKPFRNPQEVYVYAAVLDKKGDYEEIVQSARPSSVADLELLLLYLNAIDKTENWQLLYDTCKDLLFEKDFNDYDTMKLLIKAGQHVGKTYDELYALLSSPSRNASLARVQLQLAFQHNTDDAILKFYDSFKSKPSCATDLPVVPDCLHQKVIQEKTATLAQQTISPQDQSTLYNIERILLRYDPSFVGSWEKYADRAGPQLYDFYLLNMIESLRKDRSSENILAKIPQLERMAKNDPENYKVRLWLLNLYTYIGALSLALSVYKNLNIKMVQHDTLSHNLDLTPSLGTVNEYLQIYRFYMTSDHECEMYMKSAWKGQVYSKYEDFHRFSKRLKHSVSRHLLILNIISSSRAVRNEYYLFMLKVADEQRSAILSDKFEVHDNRDFEASYLFGIPVDAIPEFLFGQQHRKNYIQLQYLKEFLVSEKSMSEKSMLVTKLTEWTTNEVFMSDFSNFERRIWGVYVKVFTLGIKTDPKDAALILSALIQDLAFGNFEKHLADAPILSREIISIITQLNDLVRITNSIVRDAKVVKAARKLSEKVKNFNIQGKRKDEFNKTVEHLGIASDLERFADDIIHVTVN